MPTSGNREAGAGRLMLRLSRYVTCLKVFTGAGRLSRRSFRSWGYLAHHLRRTRSGGVHVQGCGKRRLVLDYLTTLLPDPCQRHLLHLGIDRTALLPGHGLSPIALFVHYARDYIVIVFGRLGDVAGPDAAAQT